MMSTRSNSRAKYLEVTKYGITLEGKGKLPRYLSTYSIAWSLEARPVKMTVGTLVHFSARIILQSFICIFTGT